MKVTVSEGNTKLGRVLNISLPPVVTCPDGAPCARHCYALKAWKMYKNVRAAWEDNLLAYQEDPVLYFNTLRERLAGSKIRLVRWHVAGDIPDSAYLQGMIGLAEALPDRHFLAFTKRYTMAMEHAGRIPRNLQLVLSAWPGLSLPGDAASMFPVAWMKDKTDPDPRIPPDAMTCPGNCDTCGRCWILGRGSSVVFARH